MRTFWDPNSADCRHVNHSATCTRPRIVTGMTLRLDGLAFPSRLCFNGYLSIWLHCLRVRILKYLDLDVTQVNSNVPFLFSIFLFLNFVSENKKLQFLGQKAQNIHYQKQRKISQDQSKSNWQHSGHVDISTLLTLIRETIKQLNLLRNKLILEPDSRPCIHSPKLHQSSAPCCQQFFVHQLHASNCIFVRFSLIR